MAPLLDEWFTDGRLLCPQTRATLRREGEHLIGGARPYPIRRGHPVFLAAPPSLASVHATSGSRRASLGRLAAALRLDDDGRSDEARRAWAKAVSSVPDRGFGVVLGGGPGAAPARFVNLNIFEHEDVDVVADAHALPFADGSVDVILAEAVLEHLRRPTQAAAEMHRVLRPGGLVFAATPFLQPLHGVPDHYQCFTEAGHRALFEDARFVIDESGICVGSLSGLANQLAVVLGEMTGSRLVRWGALAWARGLARVDRLVIQAPWEAYAASSTFLLARRP